MHEFIQSNSPGSPESIADLVWRSYNNPQFSMSEVYSGSINDSYEELRDFFDDTEGSSAGMDNGTYWDENQYRIKLWRYSESRKKAPNRNVDSVGVVAMHSEVLSSDGFPSDPEVFRHIGNFKEDSESENIPAQVVSFSFISENDHILGEEVKGYQRSRTSFYDIFFAFNSEIDGKARLTQVTSMPLEAGGFEFFNPKMCYPVDDHGNASKFLLWYISIIFQG